MQNQKNNLILSDQEIIEDQEALALFGILKRTKAIVTFLLSLMIVSLSDVYLETQVYKDYEVILLHHSLILLPFYYDYYILGYLFHQIFESIITKT